MSLLGEIKRRKVFQVAAVYAVVAWLTIQIVDVVGEPLNLPDWFDAVAIVLLAIGFPIAVILAWAFDLTPQGIKAASNVRVGDAPTQSSGQRFSYISQGLILVAVGFLVVDQYVLAPGADIAARPSIAPDISSRPVRRTSIDLGPTQPMGGSGLNAHVALSRDGRRLVYAVSLEDRNQLFLRELDQITVRAIPGTEGANAPILSPDGESIAFVRNGGLSRVSLRGGPVQPLVNDLRGGAGGFWSLNDTIFFPAANPQGANRLHRIADGGGIPEELFVDSFESAGTHGWPHILPSGEHLLFTVSPSNGSARDGHVALLSLETGESRTLIERAYNARYAPTGHIIFVRSAALWAVPFDAERLVRTGEEALIVNAVQTSGGRGTSVYAFSDDGLLVYLSGIDTFLSTPIMQFVWVNRDGEEEPIDFEPGAYLQPTLSPDGSRLAYQAVDSDGNVDLWIYDLRRGIPTRLTFNAGVDRVPIWTPNGQRVVYWSEREEPGLFWKAADGTGEAERLTTAERRQIPSSFSPDGQQLLFSEQQVAGASVYVLSVGENQSPQPLLISTEFDIEDAEVSPDGRWVAYTSDESGEEEIYLRPFPNVDDDRWRVSKGGGEESIWGPDSREIFYRNGGTLFSVSVDSEPTLSLGRPEVLITGNYSSVNRNTYDISTDGQRFLMMVSTERIAQLNEQTSLIVVDNWFEELNRLAPRSE